MNDLVKSTEGVYVMDAKVDEDTSNVICERGSGEAD